MVVKLGQYYINLNEVLYIKKIGEGCNVIFKNDKVLSIVTVSGMDWVYLRDIRTVKLQEVAK